MSITNTAENVRMCVAEKIVDYRLAHKEAAVIDAAAADRFSFRFNALPRW